MVVYLHFKKSFYPVIYNKHRAHVFWQNIFNFIDLVMKYYIGTTNLEPSMNQTIYKTDFIAKSCKTTILRKKSNRRFLPIH